MGLLSLEWLQGQPCSITSFSCLSALSLCPPPPPSHTSTTLVTREHSLVLHMGLIVKYMVNHLLTQHLLHHHHLPTHILPLPTPDHHSTTLLSMLLHLLMDLVLTMAERSVMWTMWRRMPRCVFQHSRLSVRKRMSRMDL